MAGLQFPTLLIIGDADVVRPEHTVEISRLLGGALIGDLESLRPAQLAILPGTSHAGSAGQDRLAAVDDPGVPDAGA